eukprot:3401785-Prymnesium_polylepis.1
MRTAHASSSPRVLWRSPGAHPSLSPTGASRRTAAPKPSGSSRDGTMRRTPKPHHQRRPREHVKPYQPH